MRKENESMRLFLDNIRGKSPTDVNAYIKRLAKESELGDEEFKDVDSLLDRVGYMEPLVLKAFIDKLIHRRREQQQAVEQEETLTKTEIKELIDSKIKEALSEAKEIVKKSIPEKKVVLKETPILHSIQPHIKEFVDGLTVLETARLARGVIVPVKDEVQYTHCWIPDLSITQEEAEVLEKKCPGKDKERVSQMLTEAFVPYSPEVNLVVGYPFYNEVYRQFIFKLRDKSKGNELNFLNRPQFRLEEYRVRLKHFGGESEHKLYFPGKDTNDFGEEQRVWEANYNLILHYYVQTAVNTNITLET